MKQCVVSKKCSAAYDVYKKKEEMVLAFAQINETKQIRHVLFDSNRIIRIQNRFPHSIHNKLTTTETLKKNVRV